MIVDSPLNPIELPEAIQRPLPLTVLYEDEYLVAVDKPAGLLVHRSNIDKHETQFLLQLLRDQIGSHIFPVHRLDKSTSGAIIFAKSPTVAAQLQMQFVDDNESTRGAVKEYLLVCRGYAPSAGVIDHPLKPINDFKSWGKSKAKDKPAQQAVTQFELVNTIELDVAVDKYPQSRYSLVRARLITGRKHQIRRHFKHIHHPIIGCPKYGKSNHNRFFGNELSAPRLLLHAYRLQFLHPVTQQNLEILAPLTGCFESLLQRLGWTANEF